MAASQSSQAPATAPSFAAQRLVFVWMLGTDFKDWSSFRACSKETAEIADELTTSTHTVSGRQVELFRWGPFGSSPAAHYLSLKTRTLGLDVTIPSKGSITSLKSGRRAWWCNWSSSFGWKGRSSSKTFWAKVRVDPSTLKVHTGDYTFSQSVVSARREEDANTTGFNAPVDLGDGRRLVVSVGEVTPFATCLDCSAPHSQRALGQIDVRGTGFRVASEFSHAGYLSAGSFVFDSSRQIVSFSGGGYCGWAAPREAAGQVDDRPGGWFLQLEPAEEPQRIDFVRANMALSASAEG